MSPVRCDACLNWSIRHVQRMAVKRRNRAINRLAHRS
jgi:hypothetical protein